VFEFGKTKQATEPFPGIEFQTTNERRSPDDLPCSEVKQSNPIGAQYRADCPEHNRSFQGILGAPVVNICDPSCVTSRLLAKPLQTPAEAEEGYDLDRSL
jgi:hypothetical protein